MLDEDSAPASRIPRAGEVVAERYVVEGTLGKGGMGVVLAAHRVGAPDERVAIKVMLPSLSERSDFAARFHREARILSSLTSEHVARVIESGNLDDGSPYIVMELLVGKNLDEVIRGQSPIPVETVAGYLLEACDAMAEAHASGVVHRDLKPSNLFLAERDGKPPIVKVLDFGICKAVDLSDSNTEIATLTATGLPLGSPQYMSPEQLRNAKDVDARTDIWALGNILHRMLTGKYAFEADSLGAHLMMVVHDPPTPLRARRPDAPRELESIVLRCLQKSPSRRFPTVASLARALAPFGPPGSDERVKRIVEQLGLENAPASVMTFDSAPTVPTDPGLLADPSTVSGWDGDTARLGRPKRDRAVWFAVGAAILAVPLCLLAWRATRPSEMVVVAPSGEAAPVAATATSGRAEKAMVTLNLKIDPPDAAVELDGARVTAGAIELARGGQHRLAIRAEGYVEEVRTVRAERDLEIDVVLKKDAAEKAEVAPPPATAAAATPGGPKPAQPPTKPAGTGKPKLKGLMETDL